MGRAATGRLSPAGQTWFRRTVVALVVLDACLAQAWADPFMGVEIVPDKGAYVVSKETPVRSRPDTKAPRVGMLKKGERVEVAGRIATGAWLAVEGEGRPLGFVYGAALLPTIDGSFKGTLKGRVSTPAGATCAYGIRHAGKSEVADEGIEISDYDVSLACHHAGRTLTLDAYMFMTESPFQLSQDEVYQISVDVRLIDVDLDNAASTVVLYQRKEERVVFDSISLKEYASPPPERTRPAASVTEALRAAVEMALSTLNARTWTALADGIR